MVSCTKPVGSETVAVGAGVEERLAVGVQVEGLTDAVGSIPTRPDAAALILTRLILEARQLVRPFAAAVGARETTLHQVVSDRLTTECVGGVHAPIAAVDSHRGVVHQADLAFEQLAQRVRGLLAAVGIAHWRAHADETDRDALVIDPGVERVAVDVVEGAVQLLCANAHGKGAARTNVQHVEVLRALDAGDDHQ